MPFRRSPTSWRLVALRHRVERESKVEYSPTAMAMGVGRPELVLDEDLQPCDRQRLAPPAQRVVRLDLPQRPTHRLNRLKNGPECELAKDEATVLRVSRVQ